MVRVSDSAIEMTSLKGKHVLITGGSEGLGLAIAQELVGLQANITLLARNRTKLDAAKSMLQGHAMECDSTSSIHCQLGDVTSADQVCACMQGVSMHESSSPSSARPCSDQLGSQGCSSQIWTHRRPDLQCWQLSTRHADAYATPRLHERLGLLSALITTERSTSSHRRLLPRAGPRGV